jgi:two-component system, NtrC family, C4-dicarboxylate transport sensor histidine kinase DctB
MRFSRKQALFWLAALMFVGGLTLFLQHIWREQGLRSLRTLNTQRLELVTTAVNAEINRQDHLPLLLSLDTDVRAALAAALEPARLADLGRKLKRISFEADTRAIFVVRPNGIVVATDDWDQQDSLLGANVGDQPYFRNAVENGKSAELAVDPHSGRIRYFLAESVWSDRLIGVVVVRVEFDALESAWERAGERIIVTEKNGIAFLASDPVYKYRLMEIKGEPPASRSFPEYYRGEGPSIAWDILEQRGEAMVVHARQEIDGSSYLYESKTLPEHGWTVHRLAELSNVDADERDGAIIGAAISALIVLLLLYTLQRHRAYVAAREAGKQLQLEVAERTRELRDANMSLQNEVDERRRTETQLRSTQNELVQAGKLVALGQMSATLAHEINQPLAAIQTFIASAKIFAKRGDISQLTSNLELISDLAGRMAALTAHLKTFARKSEPGHRERVQVDRAVEGALFLVQTRIKSGGVEVEKRTERNLFVSGHAVQLEQVIVNLLLNAIDATSAVDHPKIRIDLRSSADRVIITVSDNGPGIAPALIDRIFDPFVTTKPIGTGLGLGLSISYGIVQDFQGRIHATNNVEGGAEVTVELPRLMPEIVATAEASHA